MSANATLRRQGREAELVQVKKRLRNKCEICSMTGHYAVDCPKLDETLRRQDENTFIGFNGFPFKGGTENQPVYGTDPESEPEEDDKEQSINPEPKPSASRAIAKARILQKPNSPGGVAKRTKAVPKKTPGFLYGGLGGKKPSFKIEVGGMLVMFIVLILGMVLGCASLSYIFFEVKHRVPDSQLRGEAWGDPQGAPLYGDQCSGGPGRVGWYWATTDIPFCGIDTKSIQTSPVASSKDASVLLVQPFSGKDFDIARSFGPAVSMAESVSSNGEGMASAWVLTEVVGVAVKAVKSRTVAGQLLPSH
ncbi:hypothetical protein BKA70DRAFT_1223587 [Coprinopsis sp. MPI-PUGE-AT-0042]|nr:hypothetical protein BKA70DRAFT_1223587 [Coprinopsis sp. MPI-PUGE-AT-0042]